MRSYSLNETTLPREPRFESALALWITMWQRQLVYGASHVTPSFEGEECS